MSPPVQRLLLVIVLLGLLFSGFISSAKGAPGQKALADKGKALLQQSYYSEAEEIFRNWVDEEASDPDAFFYLALSRALQGKLDSALIGFQQALSLSPRMADACFEIGGVYLRKKEHREALVWVEKGLRLEPRSEYGLDLAGTLHFLLGSKIEALRYWNRLKRPHLTELHISSTTALDRQSIADEINLKPGSLLSHLEIEKARWRLRQHDYIRTTSFLPVPGKQADEYSLDVVVDARRRFGTPLEFVANTIAGIGFSTYRLTYWNLGDRGVTINLPLRFKSDARLAQLDIRFPRPGHLRVYAGASYTWRDESWSLDALTGPVAGVSRLRSHEFSFTALIPIREPRLSIKMEMAARRRKSEIAPEAGSSALGVSGADHPGAVETSLDNYQATRTPWQGVIWVCLAPRLNLFERRSLTGWGWNSHIQAGVDVGRIGNPQRENLSRLSFSWENRLDHLSRAGLQSTLRMGFHAGRLSSRALLEDHFLLGVGPDASFQLRAHPLFRNGMFGSTPLAAEFILGNLTIAQDVHTWKWLRLGTAIFFDAAHMPRLYAGQKQTSTAVDTGAGVEFGLPGIPSARFTLALGHDWQGRRNVLYFSTSFR